MSKNRKIAVICAAIFAAIVLATAGIMVVNHNNSEPVELSLTEVQIGKETVELKKGDEVEADAWNEPYAAVNGKEYDAAVTVCSNIAIGSTLSQLTEAFNIREGYAMINAEVPTEEHDGTTDVIDLEYSGDFFDNYDGKYLDAVIYVGFNEEDGKWIPAESEEIQDAELVYGFDINGMDDSAVGVGEVIAIQIKYN
ncbi:MAG: hypothetical protein ACI4LC_04795 [Emergencia sp.]